VLPGRHLESLTPVNFTTSAGFGLVFGSLAGACAFVIAYSEYRRNWSFTGNALLMALRTALSAFLLFFLAALFLPWLFQRALR
jgi:hypothetical protein